jgi:hypothetical protein
MVTPMLAAPAIALALPAHAATLAYCFDPAMELTYRLTRDDYRQYVKQVRARARARVVSPVPASASAWKQAVAALPVPVALLLTLAVLTGVSASGLIRRTAYAAACIA